MLISEPVVLVPARLGTTFARLLDRMGSADGGLPGELARLQAEFKQAGAAWQRLQFSEPAAEPTSAVGSPEVPPDPLSATLTSMEVSRLINCGVRNVRDLAERGSLTGRHIGGRWQFDAHDVASYLEGRRAS